MFKSKTIGMIGARGIGTRHIGGIEAVVSALSKEIAELNHNVRVYVRSVSSEDYLQHENIKLVKIPTVFTKHLETIVYTLFSSIHAALSCDVVHFHGVGPSLMCWIPRLLGKRVIVSVHGADWRRDKWGTFPSLVLLCGVKVAKYFAHSITAVSAPCADEVSKTIQRRVVVIPNGISKASYQSRTSTHKQFGLSDQGYYLFLGRLVKEKRVDLLIKAYRAVNTSRKLVIAGDAPYGSAYQIELQMLAKGDNRIFFIGSVYGQIKLDILASAYCLVLPSAIEGHAIVLLEAIDAAVPILCSDIPENKFALGLMGTSSDFSPTGITFECDNEEALRDALLFAEHNTDKLVDFTTSASRQLVSSFRWPAIASKYATLY